ncbi:hypothetical protein MCNS_27670 [Mycobacterium conspicuum]|uniref:Uncharacterized protein n=1 Tax=Mycobacterium conspicuum TaxID=44010 RepID=A0A7I7YEM4_9MYCO|nr:hypothetical protein MCNS_27670 [Mycobacterium conspicuum]
MGNAAPALAALMVEPIRAKSDVAADTASGATITRDIPSLQSLACEQPGIYLDRHSHHSDGTATNLDVFDIGGHLMLGTSAPY